MPINPENVYKEIGTRIKELRTKKGFSQDRLAAESGLDRSHTGYIEQGHRKPTISTLAKISNALGCKLEDLFKGL